MPTTIKRCKCRNPKLIFKKYEFGRGFDSRPSYRGTCTACGLTRGWYNANNYQIVTSNSPEGGEEK